MFFSFHCLILKEAYFFQILLFLAFTNLTDNKPEIKNHYRGHKLSMWLSLIPQIHSPGDSPDLSMRHHHFVEESAQFYDGELYKIWFYCLIHNLYYTNGFECYAMDAMQWMTTQFLTGKILLSLHFILVFHPSFLLLAQCVGTVRTQSMQRPPVIKKVAPITTATPIHKTETTPAPIMPSLTTGLYIFCAPLLFPFPTVFLKIHECSNLKLLGAFGRLSRSS